MNQIPNIEDDLTKCPCCGGEADNGHDRMIPPNAYYCTKCNAADKREGLCESLEKEMHPALKSIPNIEEEMRNWFYDRNPKTITSQEDGAFFFKGSDVVAALMTLQQTHLHQLQKAREQERERIISLLVDEGYLKGRELIPHDESKKSHGTCCYCGTCGHDNDYCVCEHNSLLQTIIDRHHSELDQENEDLHINIEMQEKMDMEMMQLDQEVSK